MDRTGRPRATNGRFESTSERFDPKVLVAVMAPLSLRKVALQIHVDPANLCRPLTVNQADRYCLMLGMHPVDVWPEQWLAAARGV